MNTFRFNSRVIGLSITLGSIFLLPTLLLPTPTNALPKTTFACIKKGSDPVTVARRGTIVVPNPVIIWKDNSFGKTYSPLKRCQIVSQRLTTAASQSSTLDGLNLTYGMVNSNPVICVILRKDDNCNAENILFTLKTSEIGKEAEIIQELRNFKTTKKRLTRVSPPLTFGELVDNEFP